MLESQLRSAALRSRVGLATLVLVAALVAFPFACGGSGPSTSRRPSTPPTTASVQPTPTAAAQAAAPQPAGATGEQPTRETPAGAADSSRPSVARIDFTVADIDARTRFFVDVLGAERGERTTSAESPDLAALLALPHRGADVQALRLGGEAIALRRLSGRRGRAIARNAVSRDLEFQHIAIVVRDIDVAWRRVIAAGARRISPEPQRIPDSNPNAGGIRAAYFRDAEGHPLELIWYPAGRGDPRWQQVPGNALVLGIDHTAIASSSTEASQRFYVELLGMTVAGAGVNSGVEQERLSGVPGARVAITGMRGAAGPGVELLEYQSPGPGRARMSPSTSDVAHIETAITVPDLDATITRLRDAGVTLLSDAPHTCAVCASPNVRAIIARDPDGHAVRLEGR